MKNSRRRSDSLFLETQLGIVTRTGDWFHTNRKHIKEFVPGLLKERTLQQLVEEAIAWVRSADSLALTLLLGLLFVIHPVFAAVIAIAFHFFWYRTKSSFVTVYLGKLLKLLNTDGYLLVSSLVVLSFMGMDGRYLSVGIGLLFFFLMKLGLLKMLWDKLEQDDPEGLSLNDRVFKMILVKYAMHFGKSPNQVKDMEETFVELATSQRGKKN